MSDVQAIYCLIALGTIGGLFLFFLAKKDDPK